MALQIPCTGQELIEEVNRLQDESSEQFNKHAEQLSTLNVDGFHVGDIRHSHRNTLGENYLLCNGAELLGSEGYSEIISKLRRGEQLWRKTTYIQNQPFPKQRAWLLDGSCIYEFLLSSTNGGNLHMYMWDSYQDFISGVRTAWSGSYSIPLNSTYTSNIDSMSAFKFKDKVFVKIRTSYGSSSKSTLILRTDISNFNNEAWCSSPTWDVVYKGSYGDAGINCSDNNLIIVYFSASGNHDKSVICEATTDGETFEKKVFNSIHSKNSFTEEYRGGYFQVDVLNNTFVVQFHSEDSSSYDITFYNKTQSFDDWEYVVGKTIGSYPMFYYNNYYWRSGSANVYKASSLYDFINGTLSIVSGGWKSGSFDDIAPYLIMRNSKLFAIKGYESENYHRERVCIYNENTDAFELIGGDEVEQYLIPLSYIVADVNQGGTNLENDDIYFIEAVSAINVDVGAFYRTIVFKNDVHAQLPVVSYSRTGGYTYIKAKE